MSGMITLEFETETCLLDRISGLKSQYYNIYPSDGVSQNYTLLATFLNEMTMLFIFYEIILSR